MKKFTSAFHNPVKFGRFPAELSLVVDGSAAAPLYFQRTYLDVNRNVLEVLSSPIDQFMYGGMVRFFLNDPYLLAARFIECVITDEYQDFPGNGPRISAPEPPPVSNAPKFTSAFRNPVKFGRLPAELSIAIDKSMAGTQLYFVRRYLDINRQQIELLCDLIPGFVYGGLVRLFVNDNYLTRAHYIECYVSDVCEPAVGQGPRVDGEPITTLFPPTTLAPTAPPTTLIPTTQVVSTLPPPTTIVPGTVPITTLPVTTEPEDTTIPETTRPIEPDAEVGCDDLIELWSVKYQKYYQITLRKFKQALADLDCENTPPSTLPVTTAAPTTEEVTTEAQTTLPPTTLEQATLTQLSVTSDCGVLPTLTRDKALGSITADLVVEFYTASGTLPYQSISQSVTLPAGQLTGAGGYVYATGSTAGDRYRVFIRNLSGNTSQHTAQQNNFFRALLGCGPQTTLAPTTQATTVPPTTVILTTDAPTTQPGTTAPGTTQAPTTGSTTLPPGTTGAPTTAPPDTTPVPTTGTPVTTPPPTTDASGYYYRIKPGTEICLEDGDFESDDFDMNDFE